MSKKKSAKPGGSKPAAKVLAAKSSPVKPHAAKAAGPKMSQAKGQEAKKPAGAAATGRDAAKAPKSGDKKQAPVTKKAFPINKVPPQKSVASTAAKVQPEVGAAALAKVKAPPARTIAVAKPDPAKRTQGGASKMAPRAKVSEIVLPPGYRPSEDEPFMNEMHRAYFRRRLIEWKDEILRQTRETLAILHEDSTQHADLADRATSETDRATELRTRDRQRKLIAKIDAALGRIEDGSYGYCEETGEPIGLKRLDARPIATLSVEAQERHERRERVYREE